MERRSYTIQEWCYKRRVCRATFYNLLKRGKAPRIMKVGARTRISHEADEDWQREREAEVGAAIPYAPGDVSAFTEANRQTVSTQDGQAA